MDSVFLQKADTVLHPTVSSHQMIELMWYGRAGSTCTFCVRYEHPKAETKTGTCNSDMVWFSLYRPDFCSWPGTAWEEFTVSCIVK